MADIDLLTHELPIVEQLVREAGALVADFYANGFEVAWKGANDPVTAADQAANQLLVAGLSRAFPSDGILAEESRDNRDRMQRRRVWIIDPLDGTREFIDRIGEFCIMVGLAIEGQAALGVVYQPVADQLYRGIPGLLAEVVQQGVRQPLAVSPVADPAQMRLVASRSHRDPLVDAVCRQLGVTQERPCGSVGLKVGLLATGQCDLYIHPAPGLKEWDTCAPEAILRAAGGAISDAWGRPLRYNQVDVRQRQGLVASNGASHARIVAATTAAAEAAGYVVQDGFWR
ncbi:MAG TPA: 3'(2'),5'-bisphosphate nucleotidase CysQ [Anaerolineae bacterium]|nr:3'(2'),5'-bisphosphate nucleotidase CysQ [Anaerolineae bacterium]HNU03857.1 3'(2'),5'-bisphosphate nucleotidase CysQ [Anaerolineae bacterium]